MIKHKISLTLFLFCLLFVFITSASAQVEDSATEEDTTSGEGSETKSGGVMDSLFKALGSAAQDSLKEEIDDFIGTYKGHIGEVKFLERRGNSIVLEVKYEGVKRKDGVNVQGEVLQWGEPLEGFKSTLSPIKGKSGSVVLTVGWQGQADSEWGTSSDEPVTSDQIRLSLVRETNPDRPFGELVYDFTKKWTDSSDIEAPEEAAKTEGAIELAEGETAETKPAVTIIPAGTVLKPSQVFTTKPATAVASSTQNTSTQETKSPVKVLPMKPILKLDKPNTVYDLYQNANQATWKSGAGALKFPGSSYDRQGFVLTTPNGTICPDNKAKNLLETFPQWIKNGTIEGRYPQMVLGNNFKFKAVGAMLKGSTNSDGVIMSVGIFYENRIYRVLRKRITCNGYENFEIDLSSWAGKKIQILLQVNAGNTSTQDWAVWVYPRLTNQ